MCVQGKYDEAKPLYERAIAIGEKTLGAEHADLAKWINNLVILLEGQGRDEEARRLLERAITIGEKAPFASHLAAWLSNLAHLLRSQGEYRQEALPPRHGNRSEVTRGIW